MERSKILKWVAWAVAAMILYVIIAHFQGKKADNPTYQKSARPAASKEDTATGDTTAEATKTLTAQVSKVMEENERLKRENVQFQQSIKQLAETLPQQLNTITQNQQKSDKAMEALRQEVTEVKSAKATPAAQAATQDQYAINGEGTALGTSEESLTWVSDGRLQLVDPKNPTAYRTSGSLLHPESEASRTQVVTGASLKPTEVTPVPFYTIPVGATLADTTTMSALIGRIPLRGRVVSPYEFKLIVGAKNLAANGIMVPNLDSTIVNGTVTGDMLLSCNRAYITSLTFVFQDGRISTTLAKGNEDNLGYLSTPNGNPCIPGKFYTNAPQYLTMLAGLGATQGAADAFSQSQLTQTTNPIGGATSSLTGSATKFALGRAAQQSAGDVKQWVLDRAESSFDAVYTPSNQDVVINISKQIEINYDPNGRKTAYANDESPYYRSRALD